MSTNNCAARLARSSVNFQIEALTTTRARSRKHLVLCLYKKIVRADQVKGTFTHWVQRDQHTLTIAKLDFEETISLQQRP